MCPKILHFTINSSGSWEAFPGSHPTFGCFTCHTSQICKTHNDDTVQCLGILSESPCPFFFSEEEDAEPPGSRGFLPPAGFAVLLTEGSLGSTASSQSCVISPSVKHIRKEQRRQQSYGWALGTVSSALTKTRKKMFFSNDLFTGG